MVRSSRGEGCSCVAPQPQDHDLPHDGRDGGHLRLDVLGQAVGGQRQLLADDLPRRVDVGAPIELDGDDRQPDGRVAADRQHPGRAVEHGFQRGGDAHLDLFGRHPQRLGHHRHAGPVQVGQHVDGKLRGLVAADSQQQQRADEDQQAMLQREANDCVEHEVVLRFGSASRRREFSVVARNHTSIAGPRRCGSPPTTGRPP